MNEEEAEEKLKKLWKQKGKSEEWIQNKIKERKQRNIVNYKPFTLDIPALRQILRDGYLSETEINKRIDNFYDKEQHLAIYRELENPSPKDLPNKSFHFILTKSCNANCEFCCWSSEERENSLMVSPEFFEECIIKMKKQNYIHCSLVGGEVLLHPKFKELINVLVKHKIRFTLISNSKEWERYKFLVESSKIKKWFVGMSVSLDGKKETHDKQRGEGCYDKVIEAINYFSSHNKKPSIKMCLRKDNVQVLPHVFSICEKYGLELEAFGVVTRKDFALDNNSLNQIEHFFNTFEKRIDLHNKKVGFKINTIRTSFGRQNLWTCPHFFNREIGIFPDGKIGYCCAGLTDYVSIANIKHDSIQEILNKKLFVTLYLLNSYLKILNQQPHLIVRDRCGLCRQLLGCEE